MQQSSATIETGWNVYDNEGEKIGSISEIGANYVLVQKGVIFVRDIYVPLTAVTAADPDQGAVQLSVGKDQIDQMGWDVPPAYEATESMTRTNDNGFRTGGEPTISDFHSTPNVQTGDALRVPVHEEELRATTTQAEAGEVQIRKDIVEEVQALDVPVTREEVDIRRVRVDRPADAGEATFEAGDTIRVPLREEQVVVGKETRVVEELEIEKRQVTETQRVQDTVRREEVSVGRTDGVGYGSTSGREFAGAGADRFQGSGDRDGNPGDEHYEVAGAGGGAVAGAAAGAVVGGPIGAAIGGVAGAAGGAVLGDSAENDVDDQDRESRSGW
jgi:uncharacterized protein (TIGR02271 family)